MAYKKYFNTSGPNIPTKHYTISRKKLIEKGVALVKDERYFTIWAPRQTGKSTYFHLLANDLTKEGYKVCHVNMEAFSEASEAFICAHLSMRMSNDFGTVIEANNIDTLFELLTRMNKEKLVFIVDEIEGLNPALFNHFLHSIRAAYHSRTKHALKSIILVGVANITGVVQDNASPFNTNDNLEVPYFTKEEVFELLEQHETENGQLFHSQVKEKIYDITAGQPGLVNGFGLRLTEKYSDKQMLEYTDYLDVEDWYLYEALDKNIANIVNKAKHQQKFMEELLFSEKQKSFSIYDEKTRFLYVNGLIKRDKNGYIEFWVPLYKKCLQQYFYPTMNGEAEEIQGNIDVDEYFGKDGVLNLDKIIRGYQEYAARRGFRYFIQRDEKGEPMGLLEAALIYSFETYIQSYLQVLRGKSYLEPHVALGRSDLIINVRGQEAVIEAKIYSNITQFTDGKAQLAYYIQSLGLTKGVYLVFVNSKFNHPKVVESIEQLGEVELITYIVKYDVETDFSEPRKKNSRKR